MDAPIAAAKIYFRGLSIIVGAGYRNRTGAKSLENSYSAIKLIPQNNFLTYFLNIPCRSRFLIVILFF